MERDIEVRKSSVCGEPADKPTRIMNWVPLTVCALTLAGAFGCRTAPVRPPSAFPYSDDISFRGFAEEVLVGYGTPRTHRFDDYTKGSYHVHPAEVAEGLFLIAPSYKLRLEAVAVIGPYGPIWAYDVIALIADEGCTRVNWLVMAHARITIKRSNCVSPQTASLFLTGMRELAPSRAPAADGEKNSCVVIVEAGERRWSPFDCYVTDGLDMRRTGEALDGLSKHLVTTYSAYSLVDK
jgi:hypothetical protein